MGSHRTFILPLCSLIGWTLISAFNLDTENVIRKTGDPNSLFGFSLAMHRQLMPSDTRMLLVGAPKAKALNKQKSQITGGMYNCDISSQSSSCQRVIFDNEENLNAENKQNQWMGATVQSQGPGGKILVCAHRYQRRLFVNTNQEIRDVLGRCYVLSQDLTVNDALDEDGGNWMFCDGRNRGHEQFGLCQQGLSATFTKDYHYLVFGAPGAYNWKGVVRLEQKNSSLWEEGIFDDGPYETGDESRLDPNLVPVPASSYLGFSLDSGKMLTKKGQLTIVAGAPRANHSGAVLLFKKEKSSMLTAEYILEGPGLASSFGYDLAVLDINADGWQDIVVGAPQFFVKDGDIGGAIYVYLNKQGAWDKISPKRIDGAANSMFGLAVENMGDVNLDGYQDVAVGAPYDNNGLGNVFIFHGSTEGLNKAQVLTGKDLNVKLFGYSLAGNMDLDKNHYPDLAIGSLSDSVFVYRAKSVISIEKTVTTSPKELDLTQKNCGNTICLEVKACFKFSVNPKTYNPTLKVAYTMRAETERRKLNLPSRVVFTQNSPNDPEHESTGVIELKGQGTESCITRGLKLLEIIRDKLRGIPIEVSVSILNQSTRRKRQSSLPNLPPILDANQDATTVATVQFIKEGCGSDSVCQSNLQLKYKFHTKEPNRDVFHPLPEENGVPVMSLSDQKEIALEITVTNPGEDAYEALLSASFPKSLSYSAVRTKSGDKPVNCVANQNGSQANCELGNPFKRDAESIFYIILSTGGISLDTTEIEIDLKLKTTSEQKQQSVKAKAIVKIELLLSLSGIAKPSQVFFMGDIKGESAMKLVTDVGNPIDYEFRVTNLGKPLKSFGKASMLIQWPKHNSQGKWLLYLMKMTSTGLDTLSCSNKDEVNKLGLKEPSALRAKREVGGETPAKEGTISHFTDKRKYTVLSCDDGAECVTFDCSLSGMDSNAVIGLRAYLWNGTFIEEYSKLNYIDIIVKASLVFKSSATNIQLKNEAAQVRVTVFPERKVAQYGGLPWWIILVAILLGLLLLGLLVFLLWKCGFFKRSKYDDSVPSYNAVRIKREERDCMPGKEEMDPLEKKQWMTSWNENESYS